MDAISHNLIPIQKYQLLVIFSQISQRTWVVEALAALAQQGARCREVVGVVGATDKDRQVFGIGEGTAAFDVEL